MENKKSEYDNIYYITSFPILQIGNNQRNKKKMIRKQKEIDNKLAISVNVTELSAKIK